MYGVSKDTVASHKKFAAKYDLNFPLLADPQRLVVAAYGVLRDKMMYGKPVQGVDRTTFIIDKDGRIAHVFERVAVEGHAQDVLAAVQGM